jgi:hypothetical protein
MKQQNAPSRCLFAVSMAIGATTNFKVLAGGRLRGVCAGDSLSPWRETAPTRVRRFYNGRAVDKFKAADWRLQLYTALVAVFWVFALEPGGGGTSEVGVDGGEVLINLLLLIPLWRGSRWAVTLLAILAMFSAGAIGSGGVPPWGPMFGALALVAAVQFLLLSTYDLGPSSDLADAEEGRPYPCRPDAPGKPS